ncbi:hypothetical protein [Ohtaekwangia koreensis]|uniref:Uncharacterized protein n=1 Tax=Ohtaekwangia koreensis TaxID=688867 RepID=A0A1T5J8F7_9BACT|nr:hypothetical protein [Ohtaekwangia koreensis]SKC47705.1 hypothetical protein SAMN05660236_0865 [Ohtaekwangia koreensis]
MISYSKQRNSVSQYALLNDSTLQLSGISSDFAFGTTEQKPVMLGLQDINEAAKSVEKYLNALTGPNGESISYKRLKPCCPFKTKNLILNYPMHEFNGKYGMLEKYSVSYTVHAQTQSVTLYINLYDETKELLAPHGFSYKKGQ